jgi:hypothetical protein
VLCCVAEADAKKESLMGSISRADVAAVCVEALTNPAAKVSPDAAVTQNPLAARLPWLLQQKSSMVLLCSA